MKLKTDWKKIKKYEQAQEVEEILTTDIIEKILNHSFLETHLFGYHEAPEEFKIAMDVSANIMKKEFIGNAVQKLSTKDKVALLKVIVLNGSKDDNIRDLIKSFITFDFGEFGIIVLEDLRGDGTIDLGNKFLQYKKLKDENTGKI